MDMARMMRSLLQVRVPRSNQDSTTTTPRHKACRRRSETHRRLAWQFGAGQPQVYSTSHEHCADSPHRHSQPGKTLSGRLEASGSAVVTRRGMCVKKLYAGQPATSARDVAMGGAEQRVLDSEKLFPLIASRRPSRGPGRSPGALDSPLMGQQAPRPPRPPSSTPGNHSRPAPASASSLSAASSPIGASAAPPSVVSAAQSPVPAKRSPRAPPQWVASPETRPRSESQCSLC
mmetsp:Transcript_28812/g.65265  ORF Transcript_28812/g.65265 Transcript_28812/m.65265 type:complete len:232 (+) Transcript_28812:533-1228(+)